MIWKKETFEFASNWDDICELQYYEENSSNLDFDLP